ncbi:MAG TPA: transposase [Ktedonobacterales bacterium]|nr:transposase [Ktedonobacterales bacterium]
MLIYEYKLDGTKTQYARMDEAIRTAQFVRNKSLRLWMDTPGANANDLQVNCSRLAQNFPFVAQLNSQARQAAADRAWQAISRFYTNCRAKAPGKKGYPRFQHNTRSVEYKVTGWKLDPDGRHLTFTDGGGIGRVRLIGTRSIETFPRDRIKRVRLIRRADGYYAQFCVESERQITHVPTGQQVGIDLGLKVFYVDSNSQVVENPRFLRNGERKIRKLHRQVSRKYRPEKRKVKQPQSHNYRKARQKLAKAYLKVQRQREDFARKTARALVSSHDLIAHEALQIRNLVRNHRLSKSIHDAAWARFLLWVGYYARLHRVPLIAVPPQYTTQACSGCGTLVRKTLSTRTHVCCYCGMVLDRDENAACNILALALATWQELHHLSKTQHRTAGQAGTGPV